MTFLQKGVDTTQKEWYNTGTVKNNGGQHEIVIMAYDMRNRRLAVQYPICTAFMGRLKLIQRLTEFYR